MTTCEYASERVGSRFTVTEFTTWKVGSWYVILQDRAVRGAVADRVSAGHWIVLVKVPVRAAPPPPPPHPINPNDKLTMRPRLRTTIFIETSPIFSATSAVAFVSSLPLNRPVDKLFISGDAKHRLV